MNRFSYFGLDHYKRMIRSYKGIKKQHNISLSEHLSREYDRVSVETFGMTFGELTTGGYEKFPDDKLSIFLVSKSFNILNAFINNMVDYIFIDSIDLYNFMISTDLNFDGALMEDKIYTMLGTTGNHEGMLYFPDITEPSIVYSISILGDNNLAVVIAEGDLKQNDVFFIPIKKYKAFPNIERKSVKLFFNTLLYMDCFPDSITNSPPDDVKKQYAPYIKKCFTIKTDETLIDRSGVTPHFRRGHFRVLRSEVYKKKRYQTIFVHSSFVKGKAKTVLDNSEKEEVMVQ